MISTVGLSMVSFGTMNWGTMSLGSSLNAAAKVVVGGILFLSTPSLSTSSWGASPYSIREMRSVETPDEAKIRELRDEEVNQLRIALGRRSGPHRLADLYFRLAEIDLESYHMNFLLEGRVHERRLAQGTADPLIDRSHSKPDLVAGIKACQGILNFKISYERLDQIYYFLAFNHQELDLKKESEQYYLQLVNRFPSSHFASVAYKELAEFSYKRSNFSQAIEYYQKAKAGISEDLWPPILHRLAWAYFRTKKYDLAIETMKETIARSKNNESKYATLKQESLQDLAILLAERGKAEEALSYFERESGDQHFFPRILEKLGEQYERNVDLSQAILVYETLLKTRPESIEASRVGFKLVELDLKKQRFAEAVQRLNQTLRQAALESGGNAEIQTLIQNLRVMVRKIATDHHQSVRKKLTSNPKADLLTAEFLYTTYLESFLKKSDPHQETPEIQMYLAEVKRDLGKFDEMLGLYRSVVQSKNPKFSKQAGELWIAALLEAMRKSSSTKTPTGGQGPSAAETEFVSAADSLAENMESTPGAREISLRAAQVQAGYESTRSDAVRRIQALIAHWPNSSQALIAAQLWVQLCLDRKKIDLEMVVKELEANSVLMSTDLALNHGKLKAFLLEQTVGLKVAKISDFEHQQDYLEAARGYEEFARSSIDPERAEKAYGNALLSHMKAKSPFEARADAVQALMAEWARRYPHSSRAVEPLKTVATQALVEGQFNFSAKIFDHLGVFYRDATSLETSARLYEALEDLGQAQQEWIAFLETYKDSPRRWAAYLALARSQEQSHLDGEASRNYRACANGPVEFQSECNCRLADLYLKDRDPGQAKVYLKKVADSKTSKKDAQVSPYVGYARFKLASLAEEEAVFEPLKFPESQLQKALGARLNFLEPLSRAYQSAVQVGGPWAIAALNRLALWATHFADEVDGIQPPPQLQGTALEKFKKDLTSISGPLREKAKSTWNESYTKAMAMNIYSSALPEIGDHLADFRVQVPGRAQGPRGQLHLAGLLNENGALGARSESTSDSSVGDSIRSRLLANLKDTASWTDYGNLLWHEGKPLLAEIADERALAINRKNLNALNNLAVIRLRHRGEEDWWTVAQAVELLQEALKIDDFYISAKINLATLMNYYRFFAKARLLWDQVLVRSPHETVTSDAQDGLGVSLQGLGNLAAANESFQKATDSGLAKDRFSILYHEAARSSTQGVDGASLCVSNLAGLQSNEKIQGFEKTSIDYLKSRCEALRANHGN